LKSIKFKPGSKETELSVPYPKSAKNYLPDWFKDFPQVDSSGTFSAKKCMPFTDSLTSGYIQELWCDLYISIKDGNAQYRWAGDIKPIGTRQETFNSTNLFPKFDGYFQGEFHWITQWEPKTPKGYSTVYSHPSARFDLPFVTFSGIIDTDTYNGTGPLPFIVKENFEGVIPAGTPIYQIHFIKRETWSSSTDLYDDEKVYKERQSVRKYFTNGYRSQYWNKKKFY